MDFDQTVVSYKSSCLREKDINYLQYGEWLNDQIINFYYEYMSDNICNDIDAKI